MMKKVYAFFIYAVTDLFADEICIPKVSWEKKQPVAKQQVLSDDIVIEADTKPIQSKSNSDILYTDVTKQGQPKPKSIDQLLKRKENVSKVEQNTASYQKIKNKTPFQKILQ